MVKVVAGGSALGVPASRDAFLVQGRLDPVEVSGPLRARRAQSQKITLGSESFIRWRKHHSRKVRTCEKTRLLTPGAEAFSSLTSAAVLAEFSGSATLPFRLTLLERVVEGVTLRSATGAMT
jgi:hypothetical protein